MLDRQIQHDTSQDLNTLKNSVNLISSTTDNIWIQQENEKQGMILKWVSSIPHLDHHDTAVRGRSEGTGGWLFHHSTYKMWETSKNSKILWLHGIPGAGKTKLITCVIDNFEPESKGHVLVFFYCNRAENSRRNEEDVLRSFVKQLGSSTTNGTIHRSLLNLYNHKQKSGFASERLSFDECGALLDDFMSAFTQCTLVLDALDECHEESRSQLIKWFTKMIKSVPNLKVLISSRRNDDIKRQLRMEANLGIEATDNEADIQKFVMETIELDHLRREEEGLPLIPNDLKDEIVKTLFVKSQGMFQWATLQTAQLLTLERGADIRAQLGKLPTGLKNAYSELWVRIEDQKGSAGAVAKRALQWMMVATSPLPINALIVAVCQDPDRDEILPIDIGEGFILGSCQNLIIVDRGRRCRFAHLSIQEYFEEYAPWRISECHEIVANVCLNFLLRFSAPGGEERENQDHDNGARWLYEYAAQSWRHHSFKLGEYTSSDRTFSLLVDFFASPNAKDSAFTRLRARTAFSRRRMPSHSDALSAVFDFAFTSIFDHWLETPGAIVDINQNLSSIYGSPFPAATISGARKTIQLLFEKGAKTNEPIDHRVLGVHECLEPQLGCLPKGLTPPKFGALALALRLANFGLGELLIENGANSDAVAVGLRCLLVAAVSYANVRMIKTILESGADANGKGKGVYHPPAQITTLCCQLLIESGLGVNSRGKKEIVRLLIQLGADESVLRGSSPGAKG